MLPYIDIPYCTEYLEKHARKKCNTQNNTFNDLNASS